MDGAFTLRNETASRMAELPEPVANNYVVDFNGADMNGDRNYLLEVMARSF